MSTPCVVAISYHNFAVTVKHDKRERLRKQTFPFFAVAYKNYLNTVLCNINFPSSNSTSIIKVNDYFRTHTLLL